MPAKSILEIDVNDAQFKQFNAMFGQFQAALKGVPAQWKNIERAQQQGVKGFRELVGQQAASIGQQKLVNEAHKAALNLLRQEEASWQRIKRQTAGAATNIRDMTGQLLKWGSLTSVFSGLLGAGGLFGISHLAEGVAGGRRSALGLGATYGGQKAFATAFDRFGDPGAILSSVADARGDITKRGAFFGAGMTDKDLTGDTADISAQLIARVAQIAKNTPDAMLANRLQSLHLDQLGFTPEYARTLKNTSSEELAAQQRMFRDRKSAYGVGSKEQRDYQDFSTALSDAGNKIETVFVKGLAPLIPGMEKLSNSIVKSIENLEKAIPPDVMDRIGKGIETFGQYLGSKDFQEDVKAFVSGVAWAAGKVRDLGLAVAPVIPKAYNTATAIGSTISNPAAAYGIRPSSRDALRVKYGAGTMDDGLGAFALGLQQSIPGFDQVTAGNDAYHKGFKSAHNEGRAFDFTIKNPADAASVADLVRGELAKKGISGRVIDEYNHPSKNATAGHIHVQTDVRVMNAAGSNVIVSAQQVAPSP